MAVNLTKGQKINLKKDNGGELSNVFLGLGWDVAKSGGFFGFGKSVADIDLDASVVLFDANKKAVDVVYFGQLNSKDGSIRHTGDNLTGAGDGDDEVIKVDLARVPNNVSALVFTVSSYRGQTFDQVENAFCRLVDESTGQAVATYKLSASGGHTGLIIAKIYRHNGEWKMHAIGEPINGRTVSDMMPMLVGVL